MPSEPVNWFTGRWPYISFLGGMVMGNRSEDLEFFYSQPFKWYTTVLDYVLTDGGKVYGLRAKFHRYKEGAAAQAVRSFLLNIRTDVLLAEYHPSYIYANGRRVWDYKKHKMGAGSIQVPFSVEEAGDMTIDMVVDKEYTPDTKGLAFRMFFLNYLGEPGVKVDLANARGEGRRLAGRPASAFRLRPVSQRLRFLEQPGRAFRRDQRSWKPNFRPDYPTDDVGLCPFCFDAAAKGKYHEFMTTYGGCNVAGNGATAAMFQANPYLRGALSPIKDPADARRILAIDPKLRVFWFRGENGTAVGERAGTCRQEPGRQPGAGHGHVRTLPAHARQLSRIRARQRPVDPEERGRPAGQHHDVDGPRRRPHLRQAVWLLLGANALSVPLLDEKLHVCLLYYLCGGSWMSAELDAAPSFAGDIVAEWVYPLVQALRFAMVHPARGRPIVPIGIV